MTVIALPSNADPFGGCNSAEGCEADSSLHIYCYGAGFNASLEDAASHAMNNSIDRDTQMTVDFVTCTSATDVRWLDANLPPGTRGTYDCRNPEEPGAGAICAAADVILDPAEINIGANDNEDQKKTACHEAGHSVGLEHGMNKSDCMINGEIPDTSAQWRTYSSHHIDDHINLVY